MTHLSKEEVIKMQIKRIEKEIRDTPYHKGTEHHIGRLRAKLAKLKDTLEGGLGRRSSGGGGGYAIKKQGDATIVLVGPPSAGKSTLINCLTNAESKVAPYSFTTVSVIPGMLKYHDAYIQILDVPGLIEGAEAGKGRGKEVLSVIRGAELLIIISDVTRPKAIQRIKNSLEENGIRIDKNPPQVSVKKKTSGGIIIHSNIKQDLEPETIKEIGWELGIKNADITVNEKVNFENLIDAFSKNKVYVPSISVLNKADIEHKNGNHFDLLLSAQTGKNIEKLKELIWNKLDFVRVYLLRSSKLRLYPKNPLTAKHQVSLIAKHQVSLIAKHQVSLIAKHQAPLIVKNGFTLKEVAEKIGPEFAQDHKKAIIWGPGARFPAQEVSLSKKVEEGMQIKFV